MFADLYCFVCLIQQIDSFLFDDYHWNYMFVPYHLILLDVR